MKALLSLVGVLGLAVIFGLMEPAPAFTEPVTSDDVQLLSEQMPSRTAQRDSRNQNGRRGRLGSIRY